jgi:hypothetical protein
MEEEWFSSLADEVSQALADARASATECEDLLGASRDGLGSGERQRLLAALVAPAAISHLMIDLIDRPPPLLLAAAGICRETSLHALAELEALELPLDTRSAEAALRRAAESCGRLLDADDGR